MEWNEQSLKMMRRIYGDDADHRCTASTLLNLGLVALNQADDKTALKWCELSLELQKRIHGADANHPSISRALYNLGVVVHKRRDYEDAMNWYKQ